MNRRNFLRVAAAGAVVPLGPAWLRAAGADRPNIIFVLSDALAQGDLGCYGQKLIKTPNLDRMAAEGTRYLQAYCGASVCAPSRASLVTGLHSGHCPIRAHREIQPEGQMPLPAGTLTVAQVLKDAGYATACLGKWGMGMFDTTGSPLKVGFDHFFGYNCQRHAHRYFPTYLYRDDKRFALPGNDGRGVGKTYAQNLIANETLDWVRKHKDRPFFLFYSITLPHGRFEIDDLGQYAGTDWTPQQKNYAAAHANYTRAACARRLSAAGRARPRRAGSGTSRARSGISSRRRLNWPGQSCHQRSSRMVSPSCRSSGVALHPSESPSTGSCTSSSSRFRPCGSATGRPFARASLPPWGCTT